MQVCAYANNIAILAWNKTILDETFSTVGLRGKRFGPKVDKKNKYMVISPNNNIMIEQKMGIRNYNFDWVNEFCYLGLLMTSENTIIEKITKRIVEGIKSYANASLIKSLFL